MYLFAFFFVIYEFTTYSANDMIMPGMISVVHHFNVSESYVALSMSYYILGNCIFILFGSVLTEYFGKRVVLIAGNMLFLLFTILIILSSSIHSFMLFRFFQGIGLSIIAIGYALIHEKFNDKNAIKLIALMGNVAILAPMLGPIIGAAILHYYDWTKIFYVTAVLTAMTCVGLILYAPKEKTISIKPILSESLKKYLHILTNKEFMHGAICLTLSFMVFLLWISQAPNIIFIRLHADYLHYVIYQVISIGGITLASLIMQFIAGEYSMYRIVQVGAGFMLSGVLICFLGTSSILIVCVGLFFYSFGIGCANGCIMRIIMSIKGYNQTLIAAMLGFIETLLFFIGIALMNKFYMHYQFSLLAFTSSWLVFGVMSYFYMMRYISAYKLRGWQ